MKKTEQYQCKSYFEGTELLDCTCGKCAKPPKKRGRPVGSKKKVIDFPENWGKIKVGDKYVDFDKAWNDIEVPTLRRIREPKMSLVNKVTWVLTAVNVAILIILIVKNV